MKTIQKHVRNLEIGELQVYRNLAIAPILGDDGNLEHIVLADALKSGMEIKEKGQGSVPSLFAINRTGKNVLAIAGEYVVGGRQNRTIVRNIYFDKQFEGEIPVRCVQQGRWSYEMPSIPMPRPGMPRVPRALEPVLPVLREEGTVFRLGGHAPLSACLMAKSQHETWNAVGEVLCCEGVRSASHDLNAVYEEKSEDFEKYKEKFPLVERQVGNIAVIGKNGNKIFVLDLFDRAGILKKYHENLVSSYALEAGLRARAEVKASKQEARGFLDSVDCCEFQEQEAVSAGKDYKIIGANLEGSALLYSKDLVYMNFFTRKQNTNGNSIRHSDISGDDMRNDLSGGSFSTGFYRAY